MLLRGLGTGAEKGEESSVFIVEAVPLELVFLMDFTVDFSTLLLTSSIGLLLGPKTGPT